MFGKLKAQAAEKAAALAAASAASYTKAQEQAMRVAEQARDPNARNQWIQSATDMSAKVREGMQDVVPTQGWFSSDGGSIGSSITGMSTKASSFLEAKIGGSLDLCYVSTRLISMGMP